MACTFAISQGTCTYGSLGRGLSHDFSINAIASLSVFKVAELDIASLVIQEEPLREGEPQPVFKTQSIRSKQEK